MNNASLLADWPAPPNVRAFTTLRHGAGESLPPFDHFNLGNRVAADGDDADTVERNRAELVECFALPSTPHWLRQVHGTKVLRFDAPAPSLATAGEGWGGVASSHVETTLSRPPPAGARGGDNTAAMAGNMLKPSRSVEKSRGRAERSAMRVRMRSMSPSARKLSRSRGPTCER